MCRTFAILIIITFATQVFFGNCFAFFCLFAGFVDDIPLVSGWIHSSFFFPLFSPYALDMWYLSCICRVVFGSYFCHTASCWKTDATANTSEQMEESWSEKILWQRSKKKMKKNIVSNEKLKMCELNHVNFMMVSLPMSVTLIFGAQVWSDYGTCFGIFFALHINYISYTL